MRAIKAKRLRKIAAHLTDGASTSYTEQVHKPRQVHTGRLTIQGMMDHTIVVPVTISLDKGCQRAVYQDLKSMG